MVKAPPRAVLADVGHREHEIVVDPALLPPIRRIEGRRQSVGVNLGVKP